MTNLGPIFEWKDWGKIPQKKGTSYSTVGAKIIARPLKNAYVSKLFVTFLFYKISGNCKKCSSAGGPRILKLLSNLPFHVHACFEGSSKMLLFLKNVFF